MHDDYVLDVLERAAGEPPSAKKALAHLRPRITRAHRLRAVARGSAAFLVLVALGSVAAHAGNQPSHVRVGATATTGAVESTTSVAPTTTVAAPDGAQSPAGGTADRRGSAAPMPAANAADQGVGHRSSVPPRSAPAVATAGAATAGRAPAGRASATSMVIHSTTATSTVSTASTPAPQTTSFEGQGGSVEVQYTDTSMSLSSVSPQPGWSIADTEVSSDSIEVTFEQDWGDGDPVNVGVHLEGGAPVTDAPPDSAATAGS